MPDRPTRDLAEPATPHMRLDSGKELLRRNHKLERQIAHLQEKINSLRTKVHNLQAGRDRLLELLKAREAATNRGEIPTQPTLNPRDYNCRSSMDDFYSEHASRYYSDLQTSVYNLMLSKLKSVLPTEPRSILDAGCGLGVFSAMLRDCFSEPVVVAFDFSAVAIDKAKQRRRDINFIVHDIYEAVEECFDLVVCTETLEHLIEPGLATRRLIEAVTPSGCLFLTVPDGRVDQSSRHVNFWSPESWRPFLNRAAPGQDIQTGVIEHPDHKQLRYNWGLLRRRVRSGSSQ